MSELIIAGQSTEEDSIKLSGEIEQEFKVGEGDTWEGRLYSPEGDEVTVIGNFYVDNPNGWLIEIIGKCPWGHETKVKYNDVYASDEDFYLVIDVPPGTIVREL